MWVDIGLVETSNSAVQPPTLSSNLEKSWNWDFWELFGDVPKCNQF